MIRIRSFRLVRTAAAVVLAAASLPAAASAQIGEPVRPVARTVIIIDGVTLQGGTVDEQRSILEIIRPAIESLEVLRGPAAAQRFGDAAREGAILVRLKSEFARAQAGDPNVAPGPFRPEAAPLLVIDGVIVPNTVMGAVTPQDIETIEVIKGRAAAEQFGARGSAGVIQIRTRRR